MVRLAGLARAGSPSFDSTSFLLASSPPAVAVVEISVGAPPCEAESAHAAGDRAGFVSPFAAGSVVASATGLPQTPVGVAAGTKEAGVALLVSAGVTADFAASPLT